jgi:hypothetical protein
MNDATRRLMDQHHTQLGQAMLELKRTLGTGKLSEEARRTAEMHFHTLMDQDRTAAMREINASNVDERDRAEQTQALDSQYKTEADHWWQYLFGTGPQAPAIPQRTQPLPGQGQNAPPNRTKSNNRGTRPPGW